MRFSWQGSRHVVGTLRSVHNRLCVEMARMTYEFLGEKVVTDWCERELRSPPCH